MKRTLITIGLCLWFALTYWLAVGLNFEMQDNAKLRRDIETDKVLTDAREAMWKATCNDNFPLAEHFGHHESVSGCFPIEGCNGLPQGENQ